MRKKITNINGVTLVEMMITVIIFFLITSGMYAMTIGAQGIWEDNKVAIDLSQNLRKAMEAISHDLRQAAPSTITDVLANGSAYTAITFKKPYGISGGLLVWNPYTTRYFLSGTVLMKIENSIRVPVATNIKTIQFRRYGTEPDAVQIYVQGEGISAKGRTIQRDLNFSVKLRNNP